MFSLLSRHRFTIVSLGLVLAGSVYLLIAQMSVSAAHRTLPSPSSSVIATSNPNPATPELVVADVTRVTIDDAAISLPVIPGSYDATRGTWTLDDTHAFFMQGSATPLIYGHATANIFEPLGDLHVGAMLRLETKTGVLSFRYTSGELIAPDDTSVLTRSMPGTLLLMTCDGVFSEHRLLLHFEFVPENRAL